MKNKWLVPLLLFWSLSLYAKDPLFFYDEEEKISQKKEEQKLEKREEKREQKSISPPKKAEKATSQDEEEEIAKNEQETLELYRKILESEKFEVKNLKRRIQINERLVQQYEERLRESKRNLERVRIDLTTRAILLKKAKEDGKIPEEEFRKRLRRITEQLQLESQELEADIEFYSKELRRLRSTLSQLKEELRVKEEARKVAIRYEKKHKGEKDPLGEEFERIYRQFQALLPKKLKPVFENDPFESPYLSPKE